MKTFVITGNTYPVRREIAHLGFIYSYEQSGYIGNCKEMTESLSKKIMDLGVEFSEIDFIEINEAYIVNQKNIRAQNKASKYEDRAIRTETKANNTDISQAEKNFLSLAEPIKIGHHSEKRHRKLVEKAWNTMGKRVELFNQAEKYEDKADYWKNKKFLTTDEKEEKAARIKEITDIALDAWRKDHTVGGGFITWNACNPLVIAKINKMTITTPTGSKWEIK